MNSSNFKRIVECRSYDFSIDSSDTYHNFPKFRIKGIDNCNFQIQVGHLEDFGLQILVKKSDKKRALAKITVFLWQREIATTFEDNWIDICLLADHPFRVCGPVNISCEIVWYGTMDCFIPIQAPLNLLSNFKNFYLNSSLSDLQISISAEELPAHKFILAAHSPVFLSMFETDMKEKRENRIVIEGIELDVMKVVLSILYSGDDKDLDEVEMALKVLIVAERYGMTTLKGLCEWKLFPKLEVSNVLDILEKADHYNAEALHAECINFIVKKKKQIAEAEDLEAICHRMPSVMCGLLEKFMTTP